MSKKKIILTSLILGVLAEGFLIFLIYFNPAKIEPLYAKDLQPWVNALFNSLSALSLTAAIMAIKNKKIRLHKILIHFSLFFSSLFLINYIFYHMSVGHVIFNNPDFRVIYLFILASHLLCSLIALPLIFITYSLGLFNYLQTHKELAKLTFLLWEYVSVTGVIIVLMIKFLNLE